MLDIPLWTPEIFQANESECREILKDIRNWRKIPLLNHTALQDLPDLSVVRFRGMVQDMLQPEIYLEKYEVKSDDDKSVRTQNGKYRDCLVVHPNESVDLDSTCNVHGERQTIFVVSIPGINIWATDFEKSVNLQAQQQQQPLKNEEPGKSFGVKRSLCDDSMEVDDPSSDEVKKKVKSSSNSCDIGEKPSSCLLSSEYLLNSPIPDRPSKACMVKIYADFEGHALNSIVDVVGFLSVNPALDGTTEQAPEFDDINEYQAANPPPSLIPRLHAVVVKNMEHNNPLMDESLVDSDYNTTNTEAVHKDLKILLTQCLFGDAIAAEYLLSHLISTIYVRTELETLGQFSLNICNIPKEALPEYTSQLYEIIESMLPASHYLPLTLENINTLQFMPKKDYNTNKLTSGLLQLAPHTHLVLDETRLQPGKVESNGVETVRNLAHLINKQQIKCDFKYYELDYNTNIPVLILSEAKSMLPSNFIVPLKPDQDCIPLIMETLKAAKHYLQPKLNNIRKYLTAARIQNFSMNPNDTEMIENDFVEIRKSDKTFGAEGLHSHLVLSRLLGVSKGKAVMDKESWQSAKEMEIERKRRFAVLCGKCK